MLPEEQPGLEFPFPFALKIIGRDEDDFIDYAVALIQEYAPDLDPEQVTVRPSRESTYISVTINFTAESREQLDAIYRDLSASERVLMVI
jgi:putative lipoic acid-binding regulatory protein